LNVDGLQVIGGGNALRAPDEHRSEHMLEHKKKELRDGYLWVVFRVFGGVTSAKRLSTGVRPAASFRREASTPVGNLG
jgi:hypothetical protein